LEKLCDSLKKQKGVVLDESNIHLFQDGGVSPRTKLEYTSADKIAACIETFKTAFPRGKVHASPENLGIALNFQRAETLAFAELKADCAYFFEDDLELGPLYLGALERIYEQVKSRTDVAYFAAYGTHMQSSNAAAPKIVPLEHHWGFGLLRSAWLKMQPWLEPFYTIYSKSDYKWRPHVAIVEEYLKKDVAHHQTSQDVAKTLACSSLSFARINTDVSYARYIGAQGQSFDESKFKELGFDRMSVVEHLPDGALAINDATIGAIGKEQRDRHTGFRRNNLEATLTEMRKRHFNPEAIVTREQVEWIWQMIMDRLPEDAVYESNVGQRSVREFRTALLRSQEARGKSGYMA
jgi:hypothetical protein